MNLKTKLDSREGNWIRVHFQDGTNITGRLKHTGADYIHVECYGKDDGSTPESFVYAQHLIPLHLIKLLTIEANTFVEAERRRLEYIASKQNSLSDDWSGDYSELEK